MSEQTSMTDRVIMWVLGSALFLSVGLLPNWLFSVYMGTWDVHIRTYITVAIVLLLIFGASKMRANNN